MIEKNILEKEYLGAKKSVKQVAQKLRCSENKVNYWLKKYKIKKRSISEAVYVQQNPKGDPFDVQKINSMEKAFLYGLGTGLYWGEGTKANKYAVRLGNSDPYLIKKFIEFLVVCFNIDKKKLKFGVQIFGDMNSENVLNYWIKHLEAPRSSFYKVTITPYRGIGNYKKKTQHGVLTIHFNNKKLRDILCEDIQNMKTNKPL